MQEYYEWLKRKGIANSSQSFYLRTLRTVLNKAEEDELLNVSPTGLKKYTLAYTNPQRVREKVLTGMPF